MSIFKETIDPTIQTQLQARTNVVSGVGGNRNLLLPWYMSKNAWVRMTSLTNYTSGKVDFNGNGKIEIIKDGIYSDTDLSKKYILEGGTLYTKTNGTDVSGSLRFGIGGKGSAYGSDIDTLGGKYKDPEYYRVYGIRPMPGITSVNLSTKGAYGSLFETQVKFYAWDPHQLNELELLFMRPGYSVLLEWGWSQYLDYTDDKLTNKLTDITPKVFNGVTF